MKILGIYAGRHRQMSEFWLQAALLGAQEAGAEVEMVNLRDLDIKPCTGCSVCHMGRFESGKGGCVFKDDMLWLDEQILSCDGMIVCAPCYENSPPSELKLFCDRLGPSHDVIHLKQAHEKLLAQGKEGYDTRWFKRRPCAFISHGGSEWTTLGLPVLSIIAVPLGMTIVDLLNYSFTNDCALQPEKVQRARQLGRHVAENCGKADGEMRFLGQAGHCPMCHNSTMVLGKKADEVTCAVCGMVGTISVENGEIRIHYDPAELEKSHVTDSGKYLHLLDMNMQGKIEMIRPRQRGEELREIVREGTSHFAPARPEKA